MRNMKMCLVLIWLYAFVSDSNYLLGNVSQSLDDVAILDLKKDLQELLNSESNSGTIFFQNSINVTIYVIVDKKHSFDSFNYLTLGGSCNGKDIEIWRNETVEIKNTLNSCGTSCWGEASCVTNCMQKKMGLSDPCSTCFGTFSECGKNNCLGSCAMCRTCSSCVDCVRKNCDDSYMNCSSLPSLL